MPSILDAIQTVAPRADAATGSNSDNPIATIVNILVTSFKPLYVDLIITCIFSAMLVPLFIVLVFFSNRQLRRKPVFIGNVFAICIGIFLAVVILYLTVTILLDPLAPLNIPVFLVFVGILAYGPNLIESILLIRLWAVYPFRITPRKTLLAIFIPIIIIKIVRITNMIIFIVNLRKQLSDGENNGENALVLLEQTWTTFPEYKIEWSLQAVDNTIASALFLAKLNKGRAIASMRVGRFASTLNSLFWIAVYNFIIPVMLSIAEFIIIWTTTDIFLIVPICIVNLYIEIIGVLLATVWSAGTRWQDTHMSNGSRVQVLTTVELPSAGTSPENSTERKKRIGM